MLLLSRLRPARVARLAGVVVPDEVPVMVVEVSVGTAELLFEGECRTARGCVLRPMVRLRVANVTLARSSSILSITKTQRWSEKMQEWTEQMDAKART